MSGPEDLIQVDTDLELLTDYLARELDPEQVADVERRLAEDEQFRAKAAPLIALWSIPPRARREPMSRALVEKNWDDFTRRAKLAHQRRKRPWLWVALFVAVVVLGKILFESTFDFIPTPTGSRVAVRWEPALEGPGEFNLRDGSRAELDVGARLIPATNIVAGSFHVRLDGAATFHVRPRQDFDLRELVVVTRAGHASTSNASFRVTARKDTTRVEVYRSAFRRGRGSAPENRVVLRHVSPSFSAYVLPPGQSAVMQGDVRSGEMSGGVRLPSDAPAAALGISVGVTMGPGARLVNLPDSGTTMVLADSTVVTLEPGARLHAWGEAGSYSLEGGARFRRTSVIGYPLVIHTSAARFLVGRGDITVRASADTTTAALHPRTPPPNRYRLPLPPDRIIVLASDRASEITQIQLNVGETVRWVRGKRPSIKSDE